MSSKFKNFVGWEMIIPVVFVWGIKMFGEEDTLEEGGKVVFLGRITNYVLTSLVGSSFFNGLTVISPKPVELNSCSFLQVTFGYSYY